MFTDISDPVVSPMGGDFTMNFSDMEPHIGQLMEVRVMMPSGRLAGRFLMNPIMGASPVVSLPGIIQPDLEYTVDFYADLNGNGMYDAPPTDHAWREVGTSDASGLTIDFTHGTDFTDVEF